MEFAGVAVRLTDGDIEAQAARLRCDQAALRAVLAVETSGRGFDDNGRPLMLFEPHVLHRLLHDSPAQSSAIAAGIASAAWGQIPYPRDQQGSYDRLERAIAIAGREIALQACSWGLGQILGVNHYLAGYDTAEDMVEHAMQGEAAQLAQMAEFLIRSGCLQHLRAHDWRAFARAYNGPSWARNDYANKLKMAYQSLSKAKKSPTADDLNAAELARLRG